MTIVANADGMYVLIFDADLDDDLDLAELLAFNEPSFGMYGSNQSETTDGKRLPKGLKFSAAEVKKWVVSRKEVESMTAEELLENVKRKKVTAWVFIEDDTIHEMEIVTAFAIDPDKDNL